MACYIFMFLQYITHCKHYFPQGRYSGHMLHLVMSQSPFGDDSQSSQAFQQMAGELQVSAG